MVDLHEHPGDALTTRQHEVLGLMSGGENVFVYGPPGTGKTTLLDLVWSNSPSAVRWHCAEFFRGVHNEVTTLGPDLDRAVDAWTGNATIVCFDEFHLHDVADAIYLRRALLRWARRGVIVKATSNYPPAGLLPNPMLHHAAEPVIEIVESTFLIIELDEGIDHRVNRLPGDARAGFGAGRWLTPVDTPTLDGQVVVNGRKLAVVDRPGSRTVVETSFAALCGHPWSTSDYLTVVGGVTRLVVHDVPSPRFVAREEGQRFANLIDVLYDRDVTLVVYCPGPPEQFRDAVFPPLDVERTISRLSELSRR